MSRPFDPLEIAAHGVQRIEASAGTGKTHSITSLFVRLLLEQGLEVERILVVTFTEAATAELRERIRERLRLALVAFQQGEAPEDPVLAGLLARSPDRERDRRHLLRAVSDIDRAMISTIHGFCQKMLQQHALESGLPFGLELTGATEHLLGEIVDDFWVLSLYDRDPRLVALVRAGLSPGKVLAFAREVLLRNDCPVLGGEGAGEELGRRLEEFLRLFGRLRDILEKEGQGLTDYFAQAQGLTAPFRRLLERGLLERLAGFFADPEPASFALPYKTELLAAETVFSPGEVFTATALKKSPPGDHPFFTLWGELVAIAREMARLSQADLLARGAAYVRQELPQRLLAGRRQTFDDLLSGLDRALRGGQGEHLAQAIRARFPVALIDEFQDTDPVQYRIFHALYGRGQGAFFMIGDPKQAIYSFRGADIYAYLNAASQGAGESHTMLVNWRSDRTMVEAVNQLFSGPEAFFDPRISQVPVTARPGAEDLWNSAEFGQAPLQFLAVAHDLSARKGNRLAKNEFVALIPELVAGDIARLLAGPAHIGEKPIAAGDIAVLVRTNEQAGEIQEALRRRGIGAVLQSRASVFASAEAEEVMRFLCALAEPGDETLLRRTLATPMLGFAAADLERFNRDAAGLHGIMTRFFAWHEAWQRGGIMQVLLAAWQEHRTCERLLTWEDGERRLTNLRHIAELLQRAESENHFSPARLLSWFGEALRGRGEVGQEAELRLESDGDAVQLVTVHRSKGLQYPVVYCPYLCQDRGEGKDRPWTVFHDPADNWQGRIALFPDTEQKRFAAEELFAEQLRLLYVAITRARHCCMILWAPVNGYDASALAHLLHSVLVPAEQRRQRAQWQAFLQQRGSEELRDHLAELAGRNTGWSVRPLALLPLSAGQGRAGEEAPPLACRNMARRLDQRWRLGSFSHLIAQGVQVPEEREPEPELPWVAVEPAEQGEGVALARFPRGPVAGNFFHRIFELLRFGGEGDDPAAQLPELVGEELVRHGYDREQWQDPLCQALAGVLRTPLQAQDPFCLRDLADDECAREMGFVFPLVRAADPEALLGPALLARPFREHPASLPAGYAESLAALPFAPLRGFLKGFMDLVFARQGKWYILDYKSNHLGKSRADYAWERLPSAMAEHHYYLQYHIYTVALHRYLAARLPDYRYDTHFGGVFYLFLKGMHPGSGPAAGVFHDLPPVERIEMLSALFAQGGPA